MVSAGFAAAGLALASSQGTTVAPAATLSGWSAVALVLALRPGARRLTGVAIAAPTLALGIAGLDAVAIWSSTAFQAVALLTIGAPLGLLVLAVTGHRWSVAVALGAAAGALAAITDLDRLTVLPGLVALALGLTGFLIVVAARQPVGVVDAELLTVATFIGVLGAGLWCGPASVATAAVALVVVWRVPPIAPAPTEARPTSPGATNQTGNRRRRSLVVNRPIIRMLTVSLALGAALTLAVPAAAGAAAATDVAPAAATEGWVRVGHFAPAQRPVNLLIDDRVIARGVAFRDVSDYLALPAGSHRFVLQEPAGPVVLDVRAAVPANGAVTIAAVSTRAGLAGHVYDDHLQAPPAGHALVRFIDTAPDVPAVDISLTGGAMLATGVAYPDATPYAPVAAGTYDLSMKAQQGGQELVKVQGWTAGAGQQLSVVLVKNPDGQLDVVPVVDSIGTGQMPAGGAATGLGGLARPATSDGNLEVRTQCRHRHRCPRRARHRRHPDPSPSARRPTDMTRRRRWVAPAVLVTALSTTAGTPPARAVAPRARPASMDVRPSPTTTTTRSTTTTTSPTTTTTTTTTTRPRPTAVPVRSGAAVNARAPTGEPTQLDLPTIGVSTGLLRLGLAADGTATVPDDPVRAGWFAAGPRPGEPGPAVILGHRRHAFGPSGLRPPRAAAAG